MPFQRCRRCGASFEVAVAAFASDCLECAIETNPLITRPLVVVADDDASTASWIRDVLQLAGYRVLLARDGDAAITLLRRESPALLLTDLSMPSADGWELTERVRRELPDQRIGIFTAETRAPADVPALRKPAGIDELLRFVSRCLERRRNRAAG